MHGMKSHKLVVGLCGLASLGLMAAVQGCSSSSSGGGTGGAAAGSSGGLGGKGGTAGMTVNGAGGSSVDAGPPLCTGVALAGAPLITDFSDVAIPDGGTTLVIPGKGGVSGYGGVNTTVTGGKLVVSGTVAGNVYAGASIYFNDCIDATAYTGVMFTLSGDFGACDMFKLGVNFPQVETNPPAGHGVCVPPAAPAANNCYGPGSAYTTATTMVTFASMNGGGAVATVTADAKNRITGLGFGFHGPVAADGSTGGCTVNFTVDDLKFY